MKIKTILKAKRISLLCLIILFVIAVIHISINCVVLYKDPTTSFPWYSAILFTGILYVIPLIITLGIFFYLALKSR